MRLLVIEDDPTIAHNLQVLLALDTYAVDICLSGREGQDRALAEDYDLIVLDWMLPDASGLAICQSLRSHHRSTPVLMLTAKTLDEDLIDGLDAGADDYLTKPFDADVLRARVRALLRRLDKPPTNPTITIADLSVDTNNHQVARAGRLIDLSPKEYALLEYLVTHPGVAFDRLELLNHVWDENANLFSNTVDVHILYLRQKIDQGQSPLLIHTIKGKGYMLCALPPSPTG